MVKNKKRIFILALSCSYLSIFGNTTQEIIEQTDTLKRFTKYIIPAMLITYGVVNQFVDPLQNLDLAINEEIKNKVTRKYTFDDYLQYVPHVAMYALNLSRIKSKHNLRDQTILLANAAILTSLTVQTTKRIVELPRPNGGNHSFPSGHTATAFLGAHLLYKEYKDISPWIGISGYLSAATVGSFRMINRRHWLSDVIAGAGVGILCVEISYLILPVYHRWLGIGEDRKNEAITITPLIGTDFYGAGLTWRF
jgi:membrane-associated phospholipid phosphatase